MLRKPSLMAPEADLAARETHVFLVTLITQHCKHHADTNSQNGPTEQNQTVILTY